MVFGENNCINVIDGKCDRLFNTLPTPVVPTRRLESSGMLCHVDWLFVTCVVRDHCLHSGASQPGLLTLRMKHCAFIKWWYMFTI